MQQGVKTYRAFISYSQQDAKWGKRLHRWLETYRIPAGIIEGVDGPVALGRFFRDEEDMPAAPNIASVVEKSIAQSENLIVICSPRSAQSKWVDAEIESFLKLRPDGKAFAFIIDGIPNADDPAVECFPDTFKRRAPEAEGENMPIEPLGLDIRKDGAERACARLAAGLLDIDFDALWQRDRRRAAQRQRWLISGMAGLTAVFACLATIAVVLGLQARANAREAHDNLSAFFAERAWQKLEEDDTLSAARYALAGMHLSPRNARLYQSALSAILFDTGGPLPPLTHDGAVYGAEFSPDGEQIVTATHLAKNQRQQPAMSDC
ncbi:MAG: toll/interleukin-1 receptor domain-containing protein, partial [Pseudomonadota bacterium]